MVVAVCSATSSRTRSRPCRYTSMPLAMRSSLLAPNPARPSSLPALIATARSSTDWTPRSWLSCRARFGPRPGTRVSSRTPGGILARSSSSALMAGLAVLGDLGRDRGADAGDGPQARGVKLADIVSPAADRTGRLLVVPGPEHVAAGDLGQLGVLPQQPRDFLVCPGHDPNLLGGSGVVPRDQHRISRGVRGVVPPGVSRVSP